MAKVEMYLTNWCPYCLHAKTLLGQKGVDYREIDVGADPALREEMTQRSGGTTVPQILIDDRPIGGCEELYALDRSGELDPLLGLAPQASG